MSRDALTILCPAKVNLALSVGPPRAGDGLHPICSWMVAIDFGDTLSLTRATGDDSSYEIRIAEDAPSAQQIDWPIESDLAFRAHQLMRQHVGEDLPVDMELIKRIPAGAGLGGGSSNAAGMLAGLNLLFSLGLADELLIQLGLRLGSDVGFMVWAQLDKASQGNGSAIVSGVGEQIEPAPIGGRKIHLVLVLPPVPCATSEVYRAFDRITQEPNIDGRRVRSLASEWPVDNDALFNDLSESAFEVQPQLRKIRDQVREVAGMPVHLSGSGAAMFIVAATVDDGMRLIQDLKARTGLAALCVGSMQG